MAVLPSDLFTSTLRGAIQLRSHQPETAVALLRMLGIQHAPVEQQKPLLRTWLTANPPSAGLRISLRRNGYGFVLDDVFGRPTACDCCAQAVWIQRRESIHR
jgi:hypothetical protein